MRRGHGHGLVVTTLAALICGTLGTAMATVAVRSGPAAPATASQVPAVRQGVAALAALPAAATDQLFAVATFGRTERAGTSGPSAGTRRALEGLGLRVLPMRHLPLALVSGTKAQLQAAAAKGMAADVYPDERLQYFSASSTAAMGADRVRAQGVTGKGVGVAIVDTGIDATHPDLADRVTHNMKLVGPEHLDILGGKRQPDDPPGTIVIPMEALPYNNSDTSSGHGTHVAGIVAADAHTSPDQIGMAPDADLIGYGAGDAIQLFTVLAAFDHILAHREEWGIRVVNNSWGSSGRPFDPAHPINVATKALHDVGVVVVFAAGNDGEEGTINPYSVAPWVISVGSSTLSKERSGFTSGGYEHDNSLAAPMPEDHHLRFDGDRLGLYHPDVSAPGTDIVSSGTPTGIGVRSPAAPGGTATLSGTSMSSPHVAGLAALLLEARPSLTPAQVRQALQATAVPLGGDAAFWQSGYGFTDAAAAVDLVRRADFSQPLLDQRQAAADQRVLAARSFAVRTSDLWSFEPELPLSVAGLVSRTFETEVTAQTKAVKAVASYPTLALVGANPFYWEISLTDAQDEVVATSTPSSAVGVSSLFVDLAGVDGVAYGTWKVVVQGVLGASDTDTIIGNVVTVAVAQLEPRTATGPTGARFVEDGTQTLFFQGSSAQSALPLPLDIPSPEGCAMTPGAPRAAMGAGQVTDSCHTGLVGFAVTHAGDTPAQFTASAPLGQPVVLGGRASLTLWLADPAAAAWTQAAASRVSYTLDAVDGAGQTLPVAAGDLERLVDDEEEVALEPTRATYELAVGPTTIPAGSTLRLRLRFSDVYTSGMRMLWGGAYADSGLTLTVGHFTTG